MLIKQVTKRDIMSCSCLTLNTPIVPVKTWKVTPLLLAALLTASSTVRQLPLLILCHCGTTLLYM